MHTPEIFHLVHIYHFVRRRRSPHDPLKPILIPLDRLGLVDPMRSTDAGLGATTLGHTLAGTGPTINQSVTFATITTPPQKKPPLPNSHHNRTIDRGGGGTYMQQ